MKKIIYCTLLGCIAYNTHVYALAEKCRQAVIQNPNFIEEVLPLLHQEDHPLGSEQTLLPAMRINKALLHVVSMKSIKLPIKKQIAPISNLTFSPDGKTIACALKDHSIELYDTQSGAYKLSLIGHTGEIRGIIFFPDCATVVTASYDRTMRIWDVMTGAVKKILSQHAGEVEYIALSPNAHLIASSSTRDNTVRIWNAISGALIHTLPVNGEEAHSIITLKFHPDNQTVISSARNTTTNMWNALTGELKHALRPLASNCTFDISPDGNTIACPTGTNAIHLWDSATGAVKQILSCPNIIIRVQFSPDGSFLVAAMTDGSIYVWNRKNEQWALPFGLSGLDHISISPDSSRIASALLSNRQQSEEILVWDARTSRILHRLKKNPEYISRLTYGSTGLLASSSLDYVHLWSDYLAELISITDKNEQHFLLTAAVDWFAGNPHIVNADNPLYQALIKRFAFLNDTRLFFPAAPEYSDVPICSSSLQTQRTPS